MIRENSKLKRMLRFIIKETIKKVGFDNNIISLLENFPDSPETNDALYSRDY